MGKHITAFYSSVQMALPGQMGDTFEYIRYSFPEFVHTTGDRPGERRLYTRGFWLDFHPQNGQAAYGKPVEPTEGTYVRSTFTDEIILAVADVTLSVDAAFSQVDSRNISLVLTSKGEVYAQAYGSSGGGEYVSVFDQNWGAVTSPPTFLEMAALVDTDNHEIHAIMLAGDAHGSGLIFDWFGGIPFGNDLGAWTLIPFLFVNIPGGRLVAASYSSSLQQREILVATTNTITLIRNTKHSTKQEDFASFPGETIIALTSFSVPDDTAQRAVVATTSDNILYHLWEIAYEQSVGQPVLIGTLTDVNLLEISGYANPIEPILTATHQLYRGSYTQSGGGFQYSPWPDVPVALPS